MTKADRLCIKVALWPVLTVVVGLFGFITLRVVSGASPLPAGATQYVLSMSLFVTFGAILTANFLRMRFDR